MILWKYNENCLAKALKCKLNFEKENICWLKYRQVDFLMGLPMILAGY
jgi:hypothetical protein